MAKANNTFSATATAYTSFWSIDGDISRGGVPSRTLRVFATTDVSGGTASATLTAALVGRDTNTCIHRENATVSATANRTGADGASGDYVCTVSFATTSNNKMDLLGGTRKDENDYKWVFGFTADSSLLSAGDCTIYIEVDEEI